MHRDRIVSALLIIAGLVVGLALVETGLVLLDIAPVRYAPPRWFVLHDGAFQEWGLWGDGHAKRPSRFTDVYQDAGNMGEYVPGATLKVVYASNPRGYFDADNGVVATINSLGFRGPEVEPVKPPGTTRVLGLGDSFTFGEGVRDEDTFLRRLERSFNAKGQQAGRRYEFLNTGVQGYNTRDEVLYFERLWIKLDPDVVLISFYLNDAYSDTAFFNKGEGLGVSLNAPEGLFAKVRFLDYAQHAYRSHKVRQFLNDYYAEHYFSAADQFFDSSESADSDWHHCEVALKRAVQLCRERRIPIGLVLFPELYRLEDYPFTAIHAVVRQYADSIGLPMLDLLTIYQGQDETRLWVHPTDHHPNESGHAMAAQAIAPFLEQLMRQKGR